MTRGDRWIGRGIAVAGLAFGVAYLVWRVTSTLDGAPPLLAAVMLLVEVVGVVGVAAMVWALWRAPHTVPPRASRARQLVDAPGDMPIDVDVLVRCSGQDLESLRATMLAVRGMGALHVLDLGARPEIASLALDAEAVYIATDPEDLDGLGQALHALAAPAVLLLEAGDVPHPDIVPILLPWLDDGAVAIVQGAGVSAQRDSAEHDAAGRHDKEFERRALLPSLGARGVAAFVGSGALIRRSALIGLPIGHATRPMVQAEITAALLAEGWRIVAPGGEPVVALAPYAQPDVVESMHACEASGALHLLKGANGALRPGGQSLRQRIAQVALAVRPLAGVRRSLLIVVLLGSLLSGELPFRPTTTGLIGLWVPWFVMSAVGLWLLSEGALRPGDRLRASMRLLGASWRGVLAPNGRPEDPQYAVAGAFGMHHGVASALAVAAISVVVGLRGVSDRLTHTLAPLPLDHSAGLLVVALWSLGGGLDALRLLARRAQTRRATRVASSLPSTIGERAALVVDLTPHGAAVISEADLPVGAESMIDLVVPTASGCVSASVPVVVRNVRADFSGERRYGVEFGTTPAYVAEALVEYCIVQPAREALGASAVDPGLAEVRPIEVPDDRVLLPRRIGLRAAALVAVAGAMASSVPASAQAADTAGLRLDGRIAVMGASVDVGEPSAAPTTIDAPDGQELGPTDSVDIVVVDAIAAVGDPAVPGRNGPRGAVVTVVCSTDAGPDDHWGTLDDAYTGPVSAVVAADGSYDVAVAGQACWMAVAPPVGYMLPGETSDLESLRSPQVIDLSSAKLPLVEIVPVTRTGPSMGPARIADVVWADLDGDGVLDLDEPFVEDVTVTLFDVAGSVHAVAATDTDGRFAFADLPEGEYRIGVSNLPAGFVATGVSGLTAPFVVGADASPSLAIGLRPARAVAVEIDDELAAILDDDVAPSGEQLTRLLPSPAVGDLAPDPIDGSPAAALVVVLLATLMGLSVLAGSVRPGRSVPATRRPPTSR